MTKYKVKVIHVFSEIFDIEAENKEDAKQKVIEIFKGENFQSNAQYENTIPPEHWAVASEEEFQEMVKKIEAEMSKDNTESSNIITP